MDIIDVIWITFCVALGVVIGIPLIIAIIGAIVVVIGGPIMVCCKHASNYKCNCDCENLKECTIDCGMCDILKKCCTCENCNCCNHDICDDYNSECCSCLTSGAICDICKQCCTCEKSSKYPSYGSTSQVYKEVPKKSLIERIKCQSCYHSHDMGVKCHTKITCPKCQHMHSNNVGEVEGICQTEMICIMCNHNHYSIQKCPEVIHMKKYITNTRQKPIYKQEQKIVTHYKEHTKQETEQCPVQTYKDEEYTYPSYETIQVPYTEYVQEREDYTTVEYINGMSRNVIQTRYRTVPKQSYRTETITTYKKGTNRIGEIKYESQTINKTYSEPVKTTEMVDTNEIDHYETETYEESVDEYKSCDCTHYPNKCKCTNYPNICGCSQ